MKKWVSLLPFLGALLILFYLLPLLIQNTGSGMVVLLILLPFACFASAILYGFFARLGWWVYPLAAMLLFVPSLFLYYNSSAFIYVPVYGVITLAGSLAGRGIRRCIPKRAG